MNRFLMLCFCLLALPYLSYAQPEDKGLKRPDDYKPSKLSKKRYKELQGTWDLITIEVSGRTINYKEHDEMQLIFYNRNNKNEETKKKITNYYYKANWPARGVDRIFEYILTDNADSIRFIGVKGFNDFKIISCDKKDLVVEHVSDGNIQRWNLIRLQVKEEKKKKQPKGRGR